MTKKHPKRHDRPGVDRYGRTPLHLAAQAGAFGLVERLLGEGVDPDAADDDGRTALHFAAQANSAEVAAVLLAAGARVDPRDAYGNTPLSPAVFNSRGEGALINLLRSHGADPFAANASGQTPVGLARLIANFDTAQYFSDLPPAGEPVAAPDAPRR
jgi:uncharacterized protein